MKKNQVNMILTDQAKIRKKVISLGSVIFIILFISLAFLVLFITKNRPQYVKYKEKSNLDYQVYLKENDYYKDNFLTSDKQYIASLISNIKANFDYDLNIEKENVDYRYSYKIEADVNVMEKATKKSIYQHKDILLEEKLKNSYDSTRVSIKELVDIDYNKYNDLIKGFVNLYGLNDIESVLNVNMYVTVLSNCEDIEDRNTESVISLSIPLTTRTVSIDMKYDLVDENQEKIMMCKNKSSGVFLYLVISGIFLVIGICLLIKLLDIIKKGRTAETIYTRELKKILNNYKSYIQKVNLGINLNDYACFDVDTFTDMLEISDKINQPILMIESIKKDGVHFLIPNGFNKVLYKYTLKVSDIKKNMEGNDEKTFL